MFYLNCNGTRIVPLFFIVNFSALLKMQDGKRSFVCNHVLYQNNVICLLDGVQRDFQQNFSYIVAVSFIDGRNRRKTSTCRIMLYTSHWPRIELTTSMVIGTGSIGSCRKLISIYQKLPRNRNKGFFLNLLAITDMEYHSSLYIINYHKLAKEIDQDQ